MIVSDPRHAIIIGGSLSGLFTAIMLRSIGWKVEVFERTPHSLNSRGGGIVLQPEVVTLLRHAGLLDGMPLGVESRERIYVNQNGQIVQRMPMRQSMTSWSVLYNRSLKGVPAQSYHLNTRLVSIDAAADGVTAMFACGTRASADLLIGADGVNSTVRALMLPEVKPVYAGYVAWRGVVPEKDLDESAASLLAERFVFHQFPGAHILQYLIPGEDGSTVPGKRSFNWVWYRNVSEKELAALLTDRQGRQRATSVPPGLVRNEAIEEMQKSAQGLLAPQMASLVMATKAPFIQTIVDLSVPRMVFDRVILTGDAAFVPRPHTAASTSKAATNAMELAEVLQQPSNEWPHHLRQWEQSQLHLGEALKRQGQRLGNQSQFPR